MKRRKMLATVALTAAVALAVSACGGTAGGPLQQGSAGRGQQQGRPDRGGHADQDVASAGSTTAQRQKASSRRSATRSTCSSRNDKVQDQQQQIESMLNNGAKALIIASIDGTALTQQLADAGSGRGQGHRVRPVDQRQSPNVDYYVTFDNEKVGIQQGTSLLTGLGVLDDERQGDRRERAVQHRTVRRQPRRQQRQVLLRRRDERAAALHRQGHPEDPVRADLVLPGRHPAVEAGDRPGPDGDHPERLLHRQASWTACCPRTTGCPAAS